MIVETRGWPLTRFGSGHSCGSLHTALGFLGVRSLLRCDIMCS
jgi:hypothetical protein